MTYAQDEASLQDGDPVELYEFVAANQTFRYTSSGVNIDFDPGSGLQTFFPIPIKRSPVTAKGQDNQELSVTIPIDTSLAERFVFQIAPSQLELTVYRLHQTSGFSSVFWRGPVMGWSVKERVISIRVPDRLLSRINEEVPKIKYQQLCNNVLYDGICSIPPALFQAIGAITAAGISGDGRTITLASGTMAPSPDGWADGGLLTHQATGESRLIITHVGDVLTVLWPFSTSVAPLDNMVVNAGCDHSIATCVNKFSNEDNFNGMPFVLSQALNQTQSGD